MAVKTTPKKSTAAKAPAAAKAEVVAEVIAARDVLKKNYIVDRAVGISGVKKKDARPAVEAAIRVVFAALAEGNEINLPPHGKIRIVKDKDVPGGKMITAKIRVTTGAAKIPADVPLAETEE